MNLLPPDSAESNSAFPHDSGVLHRSALLGQRKTRPNPMEKPQAFGARKERLEKAPSLLEEARPIPLVVVSEPIEPPSRPARKPRASTPRKPAPAKLKAPDGAAFQKLAEEVARLSEALAARPTWADLQALESRMGPGPATQLSGMQHLQEMLHTREEELEELGQVVSDFQEQNEAAADKIRELTARLREAEADLEENRQDALQAQERQQLGEGFLREALLGLLSPGDEFNEDLVEQIQQFLTP